VSDRVAGNVLGLAEVGELEVQMFNLAKMYNRIPKCSIQHFCPHFGKPLLAVRCFSN